MTTLHRSATSEERIKIEEAKDRGYREGWSDGMAKRAEIDVIGLEENGFTEAAAWLRAARIVERTD